MNPIVDSVAREGILRSSRSLRNAVAKGEVDLEAREDMSIASLLGGLSLANAKLGAVHGFASVLGGLFIYLFIYSLTYLPPVCLFTCYIYIYIYIYTHTKCYYQMLLLNAITKYMLYYGNKLIM